MAERAKTNCDAIRELMTEELERDLNEFENQQVEVHIRGCPECEARLRGEDFPLPPVEMPSGEEWRRMEARIQRATGARLGPTQPARVQSLRSASGGARRSRRTRRFGWQPLWPVAATVLVALGLAIWSPESPPRPGEPLRVDAEILEVPTGSEAVIFALEESEGGGVLIYFSG